MRLLNTKSLQLNDFSGFNTPPYVILSHTWGEQEVLFDDIQKGTAASRQGYGKITGCCTKAAEDGFDWVWIDTCCIDKSSSAELSEAINSMYRWYQRSTICYVYLEDVSLSASAPAPNAFPYEEYEKAMHKAVWRTASVREDFVSRWRHSENLTKIFQPESFGKSRWFTRGWTLQELIAPSVVEFFTVEWTEIGTKASLPEQLSAATGIPIRVLRGESPSTCTVAERMSWASKRMTSREEDIAYCLLGLFRINMPMLYGEGKKAFTRLQEEIMKQEEDYSIFAWSLQFDCASSLTSILASSPADFSNTVPPEMYIPVDRDRRDRCWTYMILHDKKYNQMQLYDPQGGDPQVSEVVGKFSTLPRDAPVVTSRGLRLTLPVRKSTGQHEPSVAWIFCLLEGNLVCILIANPPSRPRLHARLSAPFLVTVSPDMIKEFELSELYFELSTTLDLLSLPFQDQAKVWGRIKIIIPDKQHGHVTLLSVHPQRNWSLNELFFHGTPEVIGVALFECANENYSTRFVVAMGLRGEFPWCEVLEDPNRTEAGLEELFQKLELRTPTSRRDRSAIFAIPGLCISAAIRKCPGIGEKVLAYSLRILACPEHAMGTWIGLYMLECHNVMETVTTRSYEFIE